jgi:hypothetical protein
VEFDYDTPFAAYLFDVVDQVVQFAAHVGRLTCVYMSMAYATTVVNNITAPGDT